MISNSEIAEKCVNLAKIKSHLLDKLLDKWRFQDSELARKNLSSIASRRITVELFQSLLSQLIALPFELSDPDRVLNNLERYFGACRSPLALAALIQRDPSTLPVLCRIFSASQYLSDLLIRDRESYDALRQTEGQPIDRLAMVKAILSETESLDHDGRLMNTIMSIKQREYLRIAYGDLIGQQQIDSVTEQISYLADAICNATLQYAYRKLSLQLGEPLKAQGQPCRYAILALGKLGGMELNYSSDIDLVFIYESKGQTSTGRRTNQQFFDRLAQTFTKLLTDTTPLGVAYRVDWRLRPNGKQGPMTNSEDVALQYYETRGRTWERQAFVKARAIAGNRRFGQRFLKKLSNWIYQSRWKRSDIESMKALKRQITRQSEDDGQERNIKTGRGGIRDIEFTIQFLQLMHGHHSPQVRTTNTLDALDRLRSANCITQQEHARLRNNYCWLRAVEHRLQIMFDLQTHTLPESSKELAKVALRMRYKRDAADTALGKFTKDWQNVKTDNREILDHLLEGAFGESDQKSVPPEVDLIFAIDPEEDWIQQTLKKYQFHEPLTAYRFLNELADEKNPFLSSRRCRHFFAAIVPDLLNELSETPNPDETLKQLVNVSDTIGGKGVLWELFRQNRPSMRLFTKLCSSCSYLCGILQRDPGMIDSLLDSLKLSRLPDWEFLQNELAELSRNAEDITPIVHAFKNDQHLRIGVRDIVGSDKIQETHRALSDVAEAIIQNVAAQQVDKLRKKYGNPILPNGDVCELAILALGKLGGRQPNYHSDLDVVFLYQSDGHTDRPSNSTTNQHFFSEVGAAMIKVISNIGPLGRLYEIDCRLRPAGKSAPLAVSFDEFAKYFDTRKAQSWERLAMCKARPIFGSAPVQKLLKHLVANAIQSQDWNRRTLSELREMRLKMQESCSPRNIKRAIGGTVDVEFLIQMLQLKHGKISPEILHSGMFEAAEKLSECHYLPRFDYLTLTESYSYLRDVESRIRLMNTAARHDLPEAPDQLAKLAFLLDEPVNELQKKISRYRQENRRLFDKYFA